MFGKIYYVCDGQVCEASPEDMSAVLVCHLFAARCVRWMCCLRHCTASMFGYIYYVRRACRRSITGGYVGRACLASLAARLVRRLTKIGTKSLRTTQWEGDIGGR